MRVCREARDIWSWEMMLECGSSEFVYEDPRRKAVPLVLNRGVPSLYEGIGTDKAGIPLTVSSGFGPVPGLSITTLKAPTSESRPDK
jgi:hypothetical protein